MDAAEKLYKRATDAATQLAEFPLRTAEVNEDAKAATERLADMERQMTWLSRAAKDVLRWLTEASRHAELLRNEAQVLTLQLSKGAKVGTAAVADLDS